MKAYLKEAECQQAATGVCSMLDSLLWERETSEIISFIWNWCSPYDSRVPVTKIWSRLFLMLWEGFLLTPTRGKWEIFVRVNKGETVWDCGTAADGVVWGVICSSFLLGGSAGCNQSLWPSGWHASSSLLDLGCTLLHCPSTPLNPVPYAWDCAHLKLVLAGKPVLVCIYMLGTGE